ncbi:MAG: YbaK/EbsC family protein [Pirellulales bacterium]
MNTSIVAKLEERLMSAGVVYERTEHAPVFTSAEAAAIRGTSLTSGAKALVCKADDAFVMFVLPADRRLASAAVRRRLGVKSLRFANAEEITRLTGLSPGAIPPFGSLFGLATHCDERLAENPRINFNAGDHTVSIAMSYQDFLKVEQPVIGSYAE